MAAVTGQAVHLVEWLFLVGVLWALPAVALAISFDGRLDALRVVGVWVPICAPITSAAWLSLRYLGLSDWLAIVCVALPAVVVASLKIFRIPRMRLGPALPWIAALLLAVLAASTYGVTVAADDELVFKGRHPFDYLDRMVYASIAGSVANSAAPDSPFAAGTPLLAAYPAFAPAVALRNLFGVPVLEAMTVFLWPSCLALLFLAAYGFARSTALSVRRSCLAAALVTLAGDMAILLLFENASRQYWQVAFGGFTSYVLLYNPWGLVLPTCFAAATLLIERRSGLWLHVIVGVALGLAALTKPFLLPGVIVGALAVRTRSGVLAAIASAGSFLLAFAVLNRVLGAPSGSAFMLAPGSTLQVAALRMLDPEAAAAWPGYLLAAIGVVVLGGAFGVRIVGAFAAVRVLKSGDASRGRLLSSHLILGMTLGSLLPALLLQTPTSPVDALQFVQFALWFLWIPFVWVMPSTLVALRRPGSVLLLATLAVQIATGLASFVVHRQSTLPAGQVGRLLDFRDSSSEDAVVVVPDPDPYLPSPYSFIAERRTYYSVGFVVQRSVTAEELAERIEVSAMDPEQLKAMDWPDSWSQVYWAASASGPHQLVHE